MSGRKRAEWAALLLGLTCAAAQAGTVAWWPFEGEADTAAGQVTNQAAPETLTGTAGTQSGGTLPVYAAEVPGTNVWDGVGGALYNADNRTALLFTGSGAAGGIVSVPDDPGLTRPADVTVEAFIKVRTPNDYAAIIRKLLPATGSSWGLYASLSGELGLRIDTDGRINAISSTTTGAGLNDGRWHHVAFSYNSANSNVLMYVDYKQKLSLTLTTPPLFYDGSALVIGHSTSAANGAFDGWIDEVRVSNEVLTPGRFLTVTRIEPEGTLAYWDFDSGVTGVDAVAVTSRVNAACMVGATTKSGTGSVLPRYADERADSGKHRILDGKGGSLVHLNRSSLEFQGTYNNTVSVPWPAIIPPPSNLTVEAFVKPDWPANFGGIFRKARASVSSPTFALSVTTNTSGVSLTARFDTNPPGSAGSNETLSPSKTINLRDGNWHHVAITYLHAEKRARLYFDYVEVGTRTTTNPLTYESGDFIIGTSGTAYYDGWIDEVRMTGRVLTTNEFLRAAPLTGTMIRMQ